MRCKLAFVADPHVGNHRVHGGRTEGGLNARCRLTVRALELAYQRARALDCARFVVLGDLFDIDRPVPQILRAVQDVFSDHVMKVDLLKGNHDMTSTAAGDHALGPLQDRARIFDSPEVEIVGPVALGYVPLHPGPAKTWLPQTIAHLQWPQNRLRILCIHLGVHDARTAPFLVDTDDAISAESLSGLCKKHGIGLVFAGNWHDRRHWSFDGEDQIDIYQVGTLCPTGWDNQGLEYGSLLVYDADADEVSVESIPGPRFLEIRSKEQLDTTLIAQAAAAAKRGNQVYLRVQTAPGGVKAMESQLRELENAKVIVKGETRIDREFVERTLREAARASASADTIDEAVAAYVKEMPLEHEEDRHRVASLCVELLARSR